MILQSREEFKIFLRTFDIIQAAPHLGSSVDRRSQKWVQFQHQGVPSRGCLRLLWLDGLGQEILHEWVIGDVFGQTGEDFPAFFLFPRPDQEQPQPVSARWWEGSSANTDRKISMAPLRHLHADG